jgi:putative SOS response-associated peptidase YedK
MSMCGRYNFTVEESEEIRDIVNKLNKKLKEGKFKTGEIFPTNLAPVLIDEKNSVEPVLSNWGFPKYNQKGVIINARAETAFEKKTFRDSLMNRRCIIPSTGFYEWDSEKRKFLFGMEGSSALYMAGLYTYYMDEMRFVILTTEANESILDVHNRMPLVIPRYDIEAWLFDNAASSEILRRVPPMLTRKAV